jgi:osmotically-inducible protein OsmY
MVQHRDNRYGRGQHEDSRAQRWRPAEYEGAQRGSGGWGEGPYAQNEYRTEHPEDLQRGGHAQRGYGQDDREAWSSDAGGYQDRPWSSEEYGQGGGYGSRQGSYGQRGYGSAGQGNYGQRQGGYGQGGQGGYGPGTFGQGSYGQGNYGQGRYGQGNYGQDSYGQDSSGQDSSGQDSYGQGHGRYGRHEQSWGSGSYGMGQGRYGQGGYGAEREGLGQGHGYGQGAYSGSQRVRRGPKGYKRSDERLKEDISERLMNSVHIDAAEVSVEVQNGKVTLEGSVPERRMKHQIEDLVDNCPGVQDIDNRVRVARGESESESGTASGLSGTGASSAGTFGSTSSRKKE